MFHDHLAVIVETEELFDDVQEHLVGKTHRQKRIARVRKHHVLQSALKSLLLKDSQELLGCVEVEDVDHHLGHLKLGLQELVVLLVTLHMRFYGLLSILQNLSLVNS